MCAGLFAEPPGDDKMPVHRPLTAGLVAAATAAVVEGGRGRCAAGREMEVAQGEATRHGACPGAHGGRSTTASMD